VFALDKLRSGGVPDWSQRNQSSISDRRTFGIQAATGNGLGLEFLPVVRHA
jgi:hypothetical protein